MATWTGAAPADCASYFEAQYPAIYAANTSRISNLLDMTAHYDIKTRSVWTGDDRVKAICALTAHKIEAGPVNGQNARAGGPLTAKSNERGSSSYATISVGPLFGVAEHLLQGTQGGRDLIALAVSTPALCGVCR